MTPRVQVVSPERITGRHRADGATPGHTLIILTRTSTDDFDFLPV
jgi:hypothetical protein